MLIVFLFLVFQRAKAAPRYAAVLRLVSMVPGNMEECLPAIWMAPRSLNEGDVFLG
jgi:hypothetical protein